MSNSTLFGSRYPQGQHGRFPLYSMKYIIDASRRIHTVMIPTPVQRLQPPPSSSILLQTLSRIHSNGPFTYRPILASIPPSDPRIRNNGHYPLINTKALTADVARSKIPLVPFTNINNFASQPSSSVRPLKRARTSPVEELADQKRARYIKQCDCCGLDVDERSVTNLPSTFLDPEPVFSSPPHTTVNACLPPEFHAWLGDILLFLCIKAEDRDRYKRSSRLQAAVAEMVTRQMAVYEVSPSQAILSLWYLQRLFRSGPINLHNLHRSDCIVLLQRALVLGFMLAKKWIQDCHWPTSQWKLAFGSSKSAAYVNGLEIAALKAFDFNLSTSGSEWTTWLKALKQFSPSSREGMVASDVLSELLEHPKLAMSHVIFRAHSDSSPLDDFLVQDVLFRLHEDLDIGPQCIPEPALWNPSEDPVHFPPPHTMQCTTYTG
ncbi:hypothetical protein BDQ12DRAFT_718456 [Crucibulum laeve]|uniref:Uncharacterized protein n=1 Tax=Crucibulum laeve TaxID=68775 RepID=A0A5C3MCP1_9AGAR|nr:hypothetical protein BDQ12DRAFT_718456 [Crucibulum laeve]